MLNGRPAHAPLIDFQSCCCVYAYCVKWYNADTNMPYSDKTCRFHLYAVRCTFPFFHLVMTVKQNYAQCPWRIDILEDDDRNIMSAFMLTI